MKYFIFFLHQFGEYISSYIGQQTEKKEDSTEKSTITIKPKKAHGKRSC